MRYLAACLLLACTYSQAGTVTGQEEGLANIEIQQFVLGQQVGPTVSYQGLPARVDFSITAATNPGGGPFSFSLDTSVFSIDSTNPDSEYHIPGIPEYLITFVNADGSASGGEASSVYHLWYFQGSVQSSDTLTTAQVFYQPWNSLDTGPQYTVSFTTDPPADPPGDPPAGVPEPSSVVMMATSLLVVFWRLKCVQSKIK